MEGEQDIKSECGGDHGPTIESSMYYLDRVPLYDTEKPYSMRYLPEEDIPQSNYVKVKHPISVRSIREPGAGPFRIEQCGFQIINIHSKLTYDEFWDNERVQSVYIPEVKQALKLETGAKYVHVLDYAVRKRHESFPVSTGKEYQYDQPTALAHIGKNYVAERQLFCRLEVKGTDRAYNTIQRDFKHLLDHAVSLYDRTKEAISVLQSSISITESHLASLQADKAGKLTFLASAFVPVSVATGLFGMNVKELPGDQISIFWFFVVAVILTMFIFIVVYFDGVWKKIR